MSVNPFGTCITGEGFLGEGLLGYVPYSLGGTVAVKTTESATIAVPVNLPVTALAVEAAVSSSYKVPVGLSAKVSVSASASASLSIPVSLPRTTMGVNAGVNAYYSVSVSPKVSPIRVQIGMPYPTPAVPVTYAGAIGVDVFIGGYAQGRVAGPGLATGSIVAISGPGVVI